MNETLRQGAFLILIFVLMGMNLLFDLLFDRYYLSIFESLIVIIGAGLILKLTDIQDELKRLNK